MSGLNMHTCSTVDVAIVVTMHVCGHSPHTHVHTHSMHTITQTLHIHQGWSTADEEETMASFQHCNTTDI